MSLLLCATFSRAGAQAGLDRSSGPPIIGASAKVCAKGWWIFFLNHRNQLPRSAWDAINSRKIKPEMAVIVVLAEDDFAIRASHGIAELVAIAPLL